MATGMGWSMHMGICTKRKLPSHLVSLGYTLCLVFTFSGDSSPRVTSPHLTKRISWGFPRVPSTGAHVYCEFMYTNYFHVMKFGI